MNYENGIVIGFDALDQNQPLHSQVERLADQFGFDPCMFSWNDTLSSIDAAANQAYEDGYEHLAVVTDQDQLDMADMMLMENYGNLFESITVIPNSSWSTRFKEQDQVPAAPVATTPVAPPQKPQPVQQVQQIVNPISKLIFLRGNPPVKGFDKIIMEVASILQTDPNAKIVFHNIGLQQYVIPADVRYDMMFTGDGGAAQFGPNGMFGVTPKIPATADVKDILKGQKITVLQNHFVPEGHPSLPATVLIAPKNMIPSLQKIFTTLNPQTQFRALASVDTDSTGKHEEIIALAGKIARECNTEASKETEETVLKGMMGDLQQVDTNAAAAEAMDVKDQVVMNLLTICNMVFLKKPITKEMRAKWAPHLSEGDKAFLDEIGKNTGIKDAIDVFNSVKGLFSTTKTGDSGTEELDPKKAKEKEKELKALAKKKKEDDIQEQQDIGFNVKKAFNHKSYKTFKSFFV